MLKATIKFKDVYGNNRQRTIQVEKNEPNSIIREFLCQCKLPKWIYVKTVKCGRTEYQWFGVAKDAIG